MKTTKNSPLTEFDDLESSLKLTGEPQRLEGTWFVSESRLSNTGKHMKVNLVPSTGSPFQGTVERLTVLLPADTPAVQNGTELDGITISASLISVDSQHNPVFAKPTLARRNDAKTPIRRDPESGEPVDLMHRIFHSCYLEGREAIRVPAQNGKLLKGAALLSDAFVASVAAPEAERPPLTEGDLG